MSNFIGTEMFNDARIGLDLTGVTDWNGGLIRLTPDEARAVILCLQESLDGLADRYSRIASEARGEPVVTP